MNIKLSNIVQTIPDDTFQQLFADACLTDENGDVILQEDGVSCISLENESGAPTAPDIEGIPVILGVPTEGQVLQATSDTIIGNPVPVVSWQWETSADGTTGWSAISGATSSDYTVQSSDVGNYLRVVQTATNTEGSDTETSASTSQVQALSTTDADYQLVLDDATDNGYALPTSSQQAHQNTLIEDLKTAGIWSKLDGLWVYANNASTSDFALYNWVDRTRATIVNTVTHAGDGFTGTGAGWIDTNHIAGTTGSNFQANSASWGIYHNTLYNTSTSNQYPLSSQSSNQRLRYANFSSGGNKMMTSNQLVAVPSSGVGLSGMQKTASGSAQGLDSAGTLGTLETGLGDVALSTSNLLNLRFISTAAFSGNLGLCWVGDQLTATEWSDFVTAVNTYMTNKDS